MILEIKDYEPRRFWRIDPLGELPTAKTYYVHPARPQEAVEFYIGYEVEYVIGAEVFETESEALWDQVDRLTNKRIELRTQLDRTYQRIIERAKEQEDAKILG